MKRYTYIWLAFALMLFSAAGTYAQTTTSEPLTDLELRSKPYFSNIQEAMKTPNDVYRLSIDATGKRRLPQEIRKFPNLQAVAIYGDKASLDWDLVVTDLQSLDNLKGLAIDGKGMEEIPFPIFKLVRLTSFEFNNAPITALPEGLFKLKNLTTLVITDTELAVVPEGIGRLTKLERLYLKRNKLEKLPGSMANLTNLKTLSIDSNYITSVPSAFKTMGKLESLSLSGNKLSEDEMSSVKHNLGGKIQGSTNQAPKEEEVKPEETQEETKDAPVEEPEPEKTDDETVPVTPTNDEDGEQPQTPQTPN
jgi:Leucine-rich repeat (LRR) protein